MFDQPRPKLVPRQQMSGSAVRFELEPAPPPAPGEMVTDQMDRASARTAMGEDDRGIAHCLIAARDEATIHECILARAAILGKAADLQQGLPRVGAMGGRALNHGGAMTGQPFMVIEKIGRPCRPACRCR